jgi:hypothetical protein
VVGSLGTDLAQADASASGGVVLSRLAMRNLWTCRGTESDQTFATDVVFRIDATRIARDTAEQWKRRYRNFLCLMKEGQMADRPATVFSSRPVSRAWTSSTLGLFDPIDFSISGR